MLKGYYRYRVAKFEEVRTSFLGVLILHVIKPIGSRELRLHEAKSVSFHHDPLVPSFYILKVKLKIAPNGSSALEVLHLQLSTHSRRDAVIQPIALLKRICCVLAAFKGQKVALGSLNDNSSRHSKGFQRLHYAIIYLIRIVSLASTANQQLTQGSSKSLQFPRQQKLSLKRCMEQRGFHVGHPILRPSPSSFRVSS